MKSPSYVFPKTYSNKSKLSRLAKSRKSSKRKDNFSQVMELRRKILILRDIIDLPPLQLSSSINEVSFSSFFFNSNLFSSFQIA